MRQVSEVMAIGGAGGCVPVFVVPSRATHTTLPSPCTQCSVHCSSYSIGPVSSQAKSRSYCTVRAAGADGGGAGAGLARRVAI